MRYTIFKQDKPKGFNFKPRYYDEAKEDLERRKRLILAELEAKDAQLKNAVTSGIDREQLKEKMKNTWSSVEYRAQANKKTNIRMAVIIAILTAIVYLILI